MADQTFDTRLESVLRQVLAAEVASLTVSVTADQVLERARKRRGARVGWHLRRPQRLSMALAAGALIVVLVSAGIIGWNFFLDERANIGPSTSASPTATSSPISTPSESVGPRTSASPAEPTPSAVQVTSREDVPLGWSSDGAELLVQRNGENLFILHADGSETQVTERLTGITEDLYGSSRPRGATISPDGSRVVFAGLTTARKDWRSCHDGALFAVSADGGPAEVLWTSQIPQNGLLSYPTFSPDGTQIAFSDGYCDNSHSVWVMNADGTDAHQVVPTDTGPLGGTHVHALSWSAAGDRLALVVDQGVYAFAADGSGFAPITDSSDFCWPSNQC